MNEKKSPIVGAHSDNRDKSTTFLWSINNAKLVISQVVNWLLLNVGYLPWAIIFVLLVVEVTI